MASINELLQEYVNRDYDELLSLGRHALVDVMPACKKVDEKNDGLLMLTSLVLTALGADGKLTRLENKFIGDLLGLDDEAIDKLTDMYSNDMVKLSDKFVDSMSSSVKAAASVLILSICACDEKISSEETALFHKLLEE